MILLKSRREPQMLRRISSGEYERMIEQGILRSGEPYELLDGLLVFKDRSARGEDPMTIGRDHLMAVQMLAMLSGKLRRHGCYMQTQGPVVMPNFSEPEPDGAIIAGRPTDYSAAKPSVKDVGCVIEVADSSLEHDRKVKLSSYAEAGVAQYLIVNLVDRVVEVYAEPTTGRTFARLETLKKGQKVELILPHRKRLIVSVKAILP